MRSTPRYIIIIATILIGILFLYKYSQKSLSIYGDSMGYYIYLPSTFIYGNLKDMNVQPEGVTIDQDVLRYATENHSSRADLQEPHWVNQYTYAVALMEMPFFLAAHLYEKINGLPADGYSRIYIWAIFFSGLFYTFLGLWLIYKVLLKYVTPLVATISLAILVLGTNLFWFTFAQIGMSHTLIFFLYTLLVYCTIRLHETPKRKYFLIIGLSAGLITIMRPTDIVCLLIPLLYGLTSRQTIAEKALLIKDNIYSIAIAAVLFIIPIVPQLLYWKWLTGSYLYYSYGDQKFFWSNPKIIEGLFYFSNGWFPYSPVMIFSLLGMLIYKRQKKWMPVLLTLIPLYVYIIYSWYCYNYINGFGSRPMIHMYPLLAIPLALFIAWVTKKGLVVKTAFILFCVTTCIILFTLGSKMAQFKFRSENANVQLYTGMLLNKNVSYKTLVSWDLSEFQPNEKDLTKISTLICQDFNTPSSDHYVQDPNDSAGYVYHVWDGEEYFKDEVSISYKNGTFNDAEWIKCSADFMYTDYADQNIPRIFVLSILDKNGNFKTWKGCKIDNKIGISDSSCKHNGDILMMQHYEYWRWGPIYFFTKMPEDIEEGDIIKLGIWNMNKKQLFFDNFCVELYK